MRIAVVSASARQPDWVRDGFDAYARRLRGSCTLTLTEVALARGAKTRSRGDLREAEGRRILASVPKGAHVTALDERGAQWTTMELVRRLERWLAGGRPVALLIGGPDGLSESCRERADEAWAVSALTLPHGLVRIVVAEAIYRAWSVLENHPYHRD
jgi:23S rRNA (pseudouridine1915-N3)-methyltransferase